MPRHSIGFLRILPASVFAAALLLLSCNVATASNVAPETLGDALQPICSVRRGHLIADFHGASLPSIFSVVFRVQDGRRRLLFTEVVPVLGKRDLLRVDDEPLDEARAMEQASSVMCYTVPILGNSVKANEPLCRAPVPVDNGISISVAAIELVRGSIFIEATLAMTMLGAVRIEKFKGDSLYLQYSGGQHRLKRLTLDGPNPNTVIISARTSHTAANTTLQLGVDDGTPIVSLCVSQE